MKQQVHQPQDTFLPIGVDNGNLVYREGIKPVVIRTTERTTFKKCRRMWDFHSKLRRGMEPVKMDRNLAFGIDIHKGLETYYDPETWTFPHSVLKAKAVAAFVESNKQHKEEYEELRGGLDPEEEEDFEQRHELGIAMLNNYADWAPEHDNFTPIAAEDHFQIPLFTESGGPYIVYVDNDNGPPTISPVVYQVRLDLLLRDDEGHHWIMDHKAQPLDSSVLTPKGWTTMGSLEVGDEVISSNGKPTKVVGIYPQGVTDCFKVTMNDGAVVYASGDHLWTIKGKSANHADKVLTTLEIAERIALGMRQATYIPLTDPVEYDVELPKPLDAYTLGVLLGDGGFTTNQITFTNSDKWFIENMVLPPDVEAKRVSDTISYRLGGMTTYIKELGLLGHKSVDKFVPIAYMMGSVEDRYKLVQGLLDTDGNINGNRVKFCTSSKRLMEDFVALIRSLGGVAHVHTGESSFTYKGEKKQGEDYYQVSIKLPKHLGAPFRNPARLAKHGSGTDRQPTRYIVKVERTADVSTQCIKVADESQHYITDGFVVTHNTTSGWYDLGHLVVDVQTLSYDWAAQQHYGVTIMGLIYNELKKSAPSPPRVLQSGKLSKDKSQSTTAALYRMAVVDHGFSLYEYADIIEYFERQESDPDNHPFFRRTRIHHNQHEIASQGEYILMEAEDMLVNPSIYPNPSKLTCGRCAFRTPCIVANEGGDIEFALNTDLYRKRTDNG